MTDPSVTFPGLFAHIKVNTAVRVANDPSGSDETLGWVTCVKSRAVDVLCVGGHGLHMRLDCLHAKDPRCETHPEMFADGDRGVFELADSETTIRELKTRMLAFEGELDAQAKRLQRMNTTIEQLVAGAAKAGTPKRKIA